MWKGLAVTAGFFVGVAIAGVVVVGYWIWDGVKKEEGPVWAMKMKT